MEAEDVAFIDGEANVDAADDPPNERLSNLGVMGVPEVGPVD